MPKIPNRDQLAWQLAHPGDNLGPGIIAASAVSSVLAVIFVVCRIWSKRILYGRFHLETNDWLCSLGCLSLIAEAALFIVATRYGLGRHTAFVENPRILQILILTAENLYALEIALVKLSILNLYQQLFRQSLWFYRATWLVAAAVIALALWVILGSDLQCVPIAATWDPTVHANCINYGLSALLSYVVNIIIDVVILAMPIPMVMKLQVSHHRKWMLILTFATGGSACIVSIVQLRYIPNLGSTSDPSWDTGPISIISLFEVAIGILAVSIPTYRPLYQYLTRGDVPTQIGGDRVVNSYAKNTYTAQVSVNSNFFSSTASEAQPHGIIATDQIELVRHVKKGGTWVQVDDASLQ
ncbi:hypothetical protein F4777DRAFT_583518 [Nemania sp. FL0916]|nr:hypothetical protein F4777DRAFT_583518 [Nemania sp. FL0916]